MWLTIMYKQNTQNNGFENGNSYSNNGSYAFSFSLGFINSPLVKIYILLLFFIVPII